MTRPSEIQQKWNKDQFITCNQLQNITSHHQGLQENNNADDGYYVRLSETEQNEDCHLRSSPSPPTVYMCAAIHLYCK